MVLRPRGEIDAARAALVCAVVRRALARGGASAILDFSDVTAIDSDGAAMVAEVASTARAFGAHLELRALAESGE